MSPRVAVVGAGIGGLACARTLVAAGAEVVVFDKGRSAGGRLATRRAPPHTFDLGAQYFTAREPRFRRALAEWVDAGVCAPWSGRVVAIDGGLRQASPRERWVGTPTMSALARHLARELDVRTGHRVERLGRAGSRLTLRGTVADADVMLGPVVAETAHARALGEYDFVALLTPPSQAAGLLDELSPTLAACARTVTLDPCCAVGLLAVDASADALTRVAWDGAFVGREDGSSSSALSWVARDSSKPGRPPGERWVLHASAAFSERAATEPEALWVDALVAEFTTVAAVGPLYPAIMAHRRWALSRAPRPLEGEVLFDDAAGVGLGGDWAWGGRVEGAYLSGQALADRILGRATDR